MLSLTRHQTPARRGTRTQSEPNSESKSESTSITMRQNGTRQSKLGRKQQQRKHEYMLAPQASATTSIPQCAATHSTWNIRPSRFASSHTCFWFWTKTPPKCVDTKARTFTSGTAKLQQRPRRPILARCVHTAKTRFQTHVFER